MPALRSPLNAAVCYLGIVLSLWVPFSLRSGMPGDTGFTYVSEISRWWNGFLNGSDLLRIHISNFYQVSYLLGELTGFSGSWVPYQIVYAALWWARGFLVLVIGRRLLPGYDVFWYLVGAFVIVHSSDQTIGWVGQMHQSAYILWMLLAFYLLIHVFEAPDSSRVVPYLIFAGLLLHLSLWAYESQLLLILLAPLLLWRRYRLPWRRWAAIAAAWYTVPVVYIAVAAGKYARSGGNTYQQSVLRKTWQAGAILSDWIFNIGASVRVWTWAGPEQAKATDTELLNPTVIATLLFLAGFLLWPRPFRIPERRTLWQVLGVGLVLLVFSFPVYMVLLSATSLWRTQILSGLGAALIFASVASLCASVVSRKSLSVAVIAVLSAPIVAYGSHSALKKAAFHRWTWERYRSVIAEVLHAAPRVTPGTLVILTNVPKDDGNGPLGSRNLWFDIAVRLAYPGTQVDGLYFYNDGTPPADAALQRDSRGRWKIEQGAGTFLVIGYNQHGDATVSRALPDFLAVNETAAGSYAPGTRIEAGNADIRAIRRYGP